MADFSHSLQSSSATISKKLSNGNGFATKTVYDDVFGGASKFGFSSRVEDYSEIFGSYHSSRGSSIPILDLPVVDEDDASIDVRSSKFDYSEVFGGFDCVDFAVPYEELFVEPKKGEKESSSEEAWTPAETGSPSEESSEELSENNQAFTNAELHHAYNDVKQFNMSYHKTNQISKDDGISGTTHIAHLNAVPAFTYVVDEEIPFRTEICDKLPSQMANSENWSLNYSGGVMEGRHFQTTMSENPACDTISRTSRSVNSSREIMVGKHFQKTTSEEPACENPACDTISRTSRSVNSSGEIMVGIHFQKTTSEEPACETVSRTSKSVNSNGGVIEGEHFQKITLEEPGCDTVSRTSKSVNSNGGVVMEGKRLQKTTSEEPAYDTVLRTSKIVNSNCGVMEGKQFKKTMSEEPAFDTVSRTSKSVNSNGVMEGKRFQKTTSEEPACDAVSRASKIAKPNGGAMEGKHFQKTSSDEPVCATCSRTCSSDFKPQRNPSGNGSYPGGVFLSVAEINLRTQPCHVPPPSRPPPKLTIKQGDPKRSMTSNLKTSTNFAHEDATSDASLPFFDVEIDASSSAAASAAAMKEAMEKAQVRLKSAKELMERKKDGLQNRKKLGLKEDIKGKESREDEIIHEACKIKEEKSHGKFEREKNELKGFDRGQKQRSTGASQVAPDFEARATVLNASQDSVDQKHVKEYRSTQEAPKLEEGAGEWKAEDQFYELVNKDEFETLAKAPEQKKAERKSVPTIESYEHEQNDMIAAKGAFKQKEENDGKFQAAAAKAQLDEAVRKLEVAKEAHECEEHDTQKEAQGLEESEQKIKGASEREEHERKLREASEWEEYENKLKEALAMEEYEKQLKEACEREEHEKKQKESPERKENEINQNEASQKEENENRQQEAREREENEKRLKGLCEVEEYEKKLLKVAEELEENKMRQKQACEANERRLKEAHERAVREREICEQEKYLKLQKEAREREENEKRVRELQEQEENEKRHEQIRKKKENERKLEEVCERQETEERPKEPFQREENKKRQQEETCEKEEYEKLQVSQEAHVGKLEEQNLGSVKIFQETAEIVKKSKATTHTCLQDEDTNSKLMNGTYEQEESYETLKRAPEPCGHEDDGKMKAAKSAFEQKENELKVASEQGERERLMEACMADSSPEHEVCESNEEVASKASLDVNEKESGEPSEGMEQEKYKKSRKGDQVAFVSEDSKNRHKAAQGVRQQVMYEKKMEAPNPVSALEEKRAKLKIFREFDTNQDTERKEKTFSEMREETENGKDRRLREQEKERLRKIEEDRERAREREKDRMAVEQATREARERAYAEACERAERAAVERATAEARQRALAEARERLEKASAEAREKSLAERASVEARLRAERAAVDRATAEARERARERVERSVSEKFSATSRDNGIRHSASFNDLRDFEFQSSNSFNSSQRCRNSSNHGAFPTEKSQGAEVESAQRCKARLERHQRTVERAAKALAEKNRRDILAQREQAERNRLAETLDADVKRWSSGKEGNLRALLSTLQYILGPDSGWQPVPLTEVITAVAVKKAYRKATLCVHPDKLQQRGASIQQKYICEKVFDLLKEAWNKFNSEER